MAKDDDEPADLPDLFIKERMKALKITGKELAERMETSEPQVSRLLNGQRRMTLGWLYAFSKAIGVPVAELFEDPNHERIKISKIEDIEKFMCRVDGLTSANVESFVTMIKNTLTANAASPAQNVNDDQLALDIRRREVVPSR